MHTIVWRVQPQAPKAYRRLPSRTVMASASPSAVASAMVASPWVGVKPAKPRSWACCYGWGGTEDRSEALIVVL